MKNMFNLYCQNIVLYTQNIVLALLNKNDQWENKKTLNNQSSAGISACVFFTIVLHLKIEKKKCEWKIARNITILYLHIICKVEEKRQMVRKYK